jgi:hypothetical protein
LFDNEQFCKVYLHKQILHFTTKYTCNHLSVVSSKVHNAVKPAEAVTLY